jgi:sensor histidine kinase YesM
VDKNERFFLFKFLNAAYRLSLVENAAKTQDVIAKMIKVFRYLNNRDRLVRLKSELDGLRTFVEIYNLSTGKNYFVICDYISKEAANAYIPSGALIELIGNALIISGETGEGETNFATIRALTRDNKVFLDILLNYIKRSDNLIFSMDRITEKFTSLCITDSIIHVEESDVKGVSISIEFSA